MAGSKFGRPGVRPMAERREIPPSRPFIVSDISSRFEMANRRLHAYFSGSVQGVGFRFTAERYAVSLGLMGWVRNLKDGRVEVVAEGAEDAIKEFLRKIDDIFKEYIRSADTEWSYATDEFRGFDIRTC